MPDSDSDHVIGTLRRARAATKAADKKWRRSGWRLGSPLTAQQDALKAEYDRAVEAERVAREAFEADLRPKPINFYGTADGRPPPLGPDPTDPRHFAHRFDGVPRVRPAHPRCRECTPEDWPPEDCQPPSLRAPDDPYACPYGCGHWDCCGDGWGAPPRDAATCTCHQEYCPVCGRPAPEHGL